MSDVYPASSGKKKKDNIDKETGRFKEYLGMDMELPLDASDIGSSASTFDRKASGKSPKTEDIVQDFPWTSVKTKGRHDIPSIILAEHRNTESTIMRQIQFYGKGAVNTGADALTGAGAKGLLDVYEEIFPENPTNNKYIFPYFNKSAFELGTQKWEQLDDIASSIKELGEGASKMAKQWSMTENAGKFIDHVMAGGEVAGAAAMTALKGMYPVVGIFDRPRIFTAHVDREITIEFPLFNTFQPWDWVKNRAFIYKFMSQNLYIKRDFITGLPPCFYRVHVPGQYFCFAACVTRFNVENLANYLN